MEPPAIVADAGVLLGVEVFPVVPLAVELF
jgi:hypothetical protein